MMPPQMQAQVQGPQQEQMSGPGQAAPQGGDVQELMLILQELTKTPEGRQQLQQILAMLGGMQGGAQGGPDPGSVQGGPQGMM